MKITAILKGRKDKDSKQTVQIRINEGSRRRFVPTKIKVTKAQFQKGKVINHPNAALLNAAIKKATVETEGKVLRDDFKKYPGGDFFKYVYECQNQWDKQRASETLRQYESEKNKLKAFDPSFDLSDIDLSFLHKYQAHLYNLGNKQNTVWKSFKFLKMIVAKAKRERLIEHNPFDAFEKPKYRDPKKEYLSKEQVNKLETFAYDETKPFELRFAAAWFVISSYTALRFGDLASFNQKKHIKNGRLIIYTSKTGEVVSMPLSEKVRLLLELIEYKPLHYTNTHYNRILKAVGALCGIEDNMNGHKARHTAAMMWANAGLSIEVVAKLMAHSSIRTTSIYFKISGSRIDDELKKLL